MKLPRGSFLIAAFAAPAVGVLATLATAPATVPVRERSVVTTASPFWAARSNGALVKEVRSPIDARLRRAALAADDRPDDPRTQAEYATLLTTKAREVGNAA